MRRLTALLLLTAVLLCACGSEENAVVINGSDAEVAVLTAALTALINGNAAEYLSAFPPEMVKDYEETDVYGYFFNISDMGAWLKGSITSYKEAYGSDITVNGALTSVAETEVDKLGDANLDYYTYKRYVTVENTQAVHTATFEYTIKGENVVENKTAQIYFVKQEGKWYLHPCFAFYSFL